MWFVITPETFLNFAVMNHALGHASAYLFSVPVGSVLRSEIALSVLGCFCSFDTIERKIKIELCSGLDTRGFQGSAGIHLPLSLISVCRRSQWKT